MKSADLEGRWDIVSWRQEYDDGRVVLPMGEKLTGFVQYHAGQIVLMIADSTRPNFSSGGQWDASVQEMAQAYKTGLFYAGSFSVEADTVLHDIHIASYPNWVGGIQKRLVELDGDRLSLKARLEEGTSEARTAILKWQRAR